MENSFNSEKAPVDRQEVLNRLKDYNPQEEVTKALVSEYRDQLHASVENGETREVHKARIKNNIALALLYKEAGHPGDAWDELNDSIDAAVNLGDRELVDEINSLLDDLESDS